LTESSARETIRRKVLLDTGSPRVETENGVLCVFCGKKLVPVRDGEAWVSKCDCNTSVDFVSTRVALMNSFEEIKFKLQNLDLEALDAGLKTYQEAYEDEVRNRTARLRSNDEVIMSLKTLGVDE
jgi:hypothetical protein